LFPIYINIKKNKNKISKQNKEEESTHDRDDMMKKLMEPKYSCIKITDKDKKANELYQSKVEPNFKFPKDFYYDLAMKYKSEIEKNEFYKDLEYMPKGCLLHQHMSDCIDINWLSEEVMKKENLPFIYMRKFRDTFDILIYTKKPNENDKPFKDIIEAYLKENEGKTVYDYFHPRLSMLPDQLENAKDNDDALSLFMPRYFFAYFLILYKSFYRQHIRNAFLQCIKDKQYRLES
jgi:hypothetical protein